MRTSVLFTLAMMTFLACTAAQLDSENPHVRAGLSVKMLELYIVNRPYSADDYNVGIKLESYAGLPSLERWVLIVVRKDHTQNRYEVQARNHNQEEIEFEADLTDASYVYVEGKDSTTTLFNSFSEIHNSLLSSRVARVGTEYTESKSSLRVWPGDINEVKVGQHMCRRGAVPCYYLSTDLPTSVSRCVTTYSNVQQCDNFITEFKDISPSLQLSIDNGELTVEASVDSIPDRVEVVVFDPNNPETIFSPENFDCQLKVNQEAMMCKQQLKNTGDLKSFMVLIVFLDEDGSAIASRMEMYPRPSLRKSSTGVIVGSVLGGMIALALVIGAVIFLIKKKNGSMKSKKGSNDPSIPRSTYDVVSIDDHHHNTNGV